MNDKTLLAILAQLESINQNLPQEISLYDVESKLDKLIELSENTIDELQGVQQMLGNIYESIPEGNRVSTDYIEGRLDSISDSLKEANTTLGDINYNVQD